jgi:hypothetical protein
MVSANANTQQSLGFGWRLARYITYSFRDSKTHFTAITPDSSGYLPFYSAIFCDRYVMCTRPAMLCFISFEVTTLRLGDSLIPVFPIERSITIKTTQFDGDGFP